jgi:hypothetical protein
LPHIQHVVAKFHATWDVTRRKDLRDASEPRQHARAHRESRNVFETLQLTRPQRFDLTRPQSPRAREAHVAAEDVPELRQFVHRRGTQQASNARDAWITLGRLDGANMSLGIGNHRAELANVEGHTVKARSLLTVEHGPAIFELDHRRDHCPPRRRSEQPDTREHHVESALGEHRPATRAGQATNAGSAGANACGGTIS